MESLKEEDLVLLQMDGSYTCPNGGIPSKEWRMHLACYRARPDVSALVHVHSSNAVAVSCMKNADSSCAIPVYTPRLQHARGRAAHPSLYDARFGRTVRPRLPSHRRAQLGASGKSRSLAVGRSMEEALNIIEEIEDEAKLFLLLVTVASLYDESIAGGAALPRTALLIGKGGEPRI